MVKRSQSQASSGESEIDHESKPTVTSESDDEYGSSPSKKQKVKGKKGSPKKASPTKSDGEESKHLKGKWTAEEDQIFNDIISDMVKAGAWQAIKDDGRLEYRGGPGCRAHAIALMNKLKKQ